MWSQARRQRLIMKEYNKLVRDAIPEIISSRGSAVNYITLSDEDYKLALKTKLVEEAFEVKNAETREQLIEELADLITVYESIVDAFGLTQAGVREKYISKLNKRGGFHKKYFLISAEEDTK